MAFSRPIWSEETVNAYPGRGLEGVSRLGRRTLVLATLCHFLKWFLYIFSS